MIFYGTSATKAPANFRAKFPGVCGLCHEAVLVGDLITRGASGGYRHVDCALAKTHRDDVAEIVASDAFDEWAAAGFPAFEPKPAPAPVEGPDLSTLPSGDLYVAVENAEGHLTFMLIARPSEGKWAGWSFVRQYLGGQGVAGKIGSQKPGAAYHGQWASLIAKVLDDPKAAAQRFASELGRCYVCGRDLTDDESRALGIGPVCRGKGGF